MTKYVIITPARDEGEHIEQTILSILGQSVRPAQWVLVDDGSRDDTGDIMERYARQHSWITVVHRKNRGFRKSGGGVVDTFYDGYARVKESDWEFLVKLDADLSFAPEYFALCFEEFAKDGRLGIGGGAIYHDIDGKLRLEKNPAFHVRGATKIYRRGCWDELDGLVRAPGWDTIDELKANMLGWSTRSFPAIPVMHHRFTGAADGAWRNAMKNGRANYIAGYHPLFMLFKCVSRSFKSPYLLDSMGLLTGFLSGYLKRTPQVGDRRLISYVRGQQMRRLLRLESIWR